MISYIKIDTNVNNTILEYSVTPIESDVVNGVITATTNYNFPTSQPAIFYRWNEITWQVELNNKESVDYYREQEGVLTGLDLEPHINKVYNSEFIFNQTKTIQIEGINFSPFSTVEISGQENFVNTTYFISPTQIKAEVTVGSQEGLFNIVVKNDQLHSQDSGNEEISVKLKTIVDLRTHDIALLGLEMTEGIVVTQDSEKGLRFTSDYNSWNRGVKFGSYSWNRNDDITLEVVFTRTADTLFMIGIVSTNLSVEKINSAYYKQEIGMFNNNNLFNTMYGGGDVTNWSQNIGSNIVLDKNKYYKIKFDFSGLLGYECSISEVNSNDWDEEIILYSWVSTCPADNLILTPFIIPQSSSGAYYITGFKY